MKRGIYLNYSNNNRLNPGVYRKCLSQYQSFISAGYDMQEYFFDVPESTISKITRRLPFTNNMPRWDYSLDYNNADFIYFRRPYAMSASFLRYMRWIKRNNPKIVSIMEVPTYPYDKELTQEWFNIPLLLKDRMARRKLNGLIDRITGIGEEKEIFGIPVIRIRNGYDFSDVPVQRDVNLEEINLACVAWFSFWHGYDRLINGLARYYEEGGKRKIYIHFVGGGSSLDEYKALVSIKKLESHVIFHGAKEKQEIQDILNKCDVGVVSLGMYRAGYYGVGASLKSREYLASGLPLITGSKTDVAEVAEMIPYILEFSNDDSIIDLDRIIRFRDELYSGGKKAVDFVGERIRQIAEVNFSMDAAMKSVFDFLEEK